MTQIREQGVNELSEVRRAYLEADGQISVIPRNGETTNGKRKKPSV